MASCTCPLYNATIHLRLYEGILPFGLNIESISNVKKKMLEYIYIYFFNNKKLISVLNSYRIK